MKPKPFSPLNHLTVPCAMKHLLASRSRTARLPTTVGRQTWPTPTQNPGGVALTTAQELQQLSHYAGYPCEPKIFRGYKARRCATSGQRNGSLPRSPTLL